MNNIPNITALRFFMALFVLLFHLPQFCAKHGIPFISNYKNIPFFNRGTESVFMFFALSGFLIIRQLYLEKSSTQTISLKSFFMRRILRIFPLYYLILIIGLLHYQIILPSFGFSFQNDYNIWYGIFLAVFFMPNIFAELYQPGGIIEILWSIGIEEQFYLFIAPLFFILPINKIGKFLLAFTLLYFIIFFNENFSWLKQFGMYFFYFSFCGLLSIITTFNKAFFNRRFTPYLLFPLIVLYFFTNVFKDNLNESGYHFISMLLFSTFIVLLSFKPIGILNNKILIYLGKISYGIYMYHAIVIQFIGFIYLKNCTALQLPNKVVILLLYSTILIVTIAIAHVSYQYFERYFLNLKSKFKF